ncbi:MAG: hypothetical protein IK038_03340 [Bacteroidaceae bacterium]|nr:hypothetical protein [Bacteroidaceae bacterium]
MSKKLTPQHIVYSTIQYEDGTHDSGSDYDVYDKEEVDVVLAEKDEEIRRLRKALYQSCTNWAFTMDSLLTNKILDGNHSDKLRFTRDRWWRMGHKCWDKAKKLMSTETQKE